MTLLIVLRGLLRGPCSRNEFERHSLPEAQIVGATDLAHSSTAEWCDDAVALTEHRARRELRSVNVCARRRIVAHHLRRRLLRPTNRSSLSRIRVFRGHVVAQHDVGT